MVHLDEIAVSAKQIQLELLLEREQRNKIVETVYTSASEDEFVVFEQIDLIRAELKVK